MADFQQIIRDIKDVKIQGAQNVARAASKAIGLIIKEYKGRPRKEILHELKKAKKTIIKTRPTEPALRNVLRYLFRNLEKNNDIVESISKKQKFIKKHFKDSRKYISLIGSKKIRKGDVVFTHCHSSTVFNILKKAKESKKKFRVNNTETRPLYQGRITARELSRIKIPVKHFVDSAGRLALKESDIMMIGADAITSEGKVINKIGSELLAEFADKYDVPLYVCTDSWKFDPKSVFGYEEEIEKRPEKEVWINAPSNVKIDNRAFEKIDPDLITGIISELGVYRLEIFVEEVKKAYPWMF